MIPTGSSGRHKNAAILPVGKQTGGLATKLILLLMVNFQVWDGVITQFFTSNGIASEGNPLMLSLVESGNFLVFKIIGIAAAAAALWFTYKYLPRLSKIAASCIAVFYAGVIAWNFTVVFSQV
jgi:hypothetical protein